MKPTNYPTPTQPKKTEVESGIWATFSDSKSTFSWVGIDFILETDPKKPNPTESCTP